jgi:CRP-like cAMP-binding protein
MERSGYSEIKTDQNAHRNLLGGLGMNCTHLLGQLENELKEIEFAKGEMVFKQGIFCSNILIIKEGIVKSFIESDKGKKIVLEIHVPGDILPLATIGDWTDTYPYSAATISKTKALAIKTELLGNLIFKNETMGRHYFNKICQEKENANRKLLIQGTKNMHGRLATALLYLDQTKFKKENIYWHFQRKDIAELAVMSIESMNKIMQELKEDLIIEVQSKEILIKDPKMLEQLARFG